MTNTTNNIELGSRADELEDTAAAVEHTGTRLLGTLTQIAERGSATPEEIAAIECTSDAAYRALHAADRVVTMAERIIEAAGVVLEEDDAQFEASVSSTPESPRPVILDAWERAFLKIAANGEAFSPATLHRDHTTFFGSLTDADYALFGERLSATLSQIIADLEARGIFASWHVSGRGLSGKYHLVIHSKQDPKQPVYTPPKRPNIPTPLPEALPQTPEEPTPAVTTELVVAPEAKITPTEQPQPLLIDTTRRDARLAEEAARAAVVLSFAKDGIDNLEWPSRFDPEQPSQFNPWRPGQLAFELLKTYKATRGEFIEAINTLIDQGVLYAVFFDGRTRVLNEPPSPELLDLINAQRVRRDASRRKHNRATPWQKSDQAVAQNVLDTLLKLKHVQQGVTIATLVEEYCRLLDIKEVEFRQSLRRLETQGIVKIEDSKVFFFDQATKESWRTDPSTIMAGVVDLIDASRQP